MGESLRDSHLVSERLAHVISPREVLKIVVQAGSTEPAFFPGPADPLDLTADIL
jgi:hypothetical protein